jgi:hypothetical protein
METSPINLKRRVLCRHNTMMHHDIQACDVRRALPGDNTLREKKEIARQVGRIT